MKSKSRVKRNVAATWLNHGFGLLIGLFLMPYVLGTVGDTTYGTWIFINSVAGYSGLLYLGFGETVCRFVSKYSAKREWDRVNEIVSVVFFTYFLMGLLAFLISAVIAWLVPYVHDWGDQSIGEIRAVVLILGLNAAIAMPTCVFGGVLLGIQRFDVQRSITLASGIARLILTIIFLQAEWGLLTLASILLAVTVLEHLGELIFAFIKVPTLRIQLRHFRWTSLRSYLSFSAYAFLDLVSMQLLELTDTILIGLVLGLKATVPYYIALRLCRFITIPITYIGSVFMPKASELAAHSNHGALQQLVLKGMGFSFLITTGFFIGAGYFGSQLIEAWVGPGYESSHLLLVMLLSAQIVTAPTGILRSVLFGMGHVRAQSLMNLAKAVLNVLLSIILIRPFGLMGVAMGTVIPVLLIETCLLLPMALKFLHFTISRMIRDAVAPQMMALITLLGYSITVAALVPYQANWIFLVATTLGGGAVLGVTWIGNSVLSKKLLMVSSSTPETSQ